MHSNRLFIHRSASRKVIIETQLETPAVSFALETASVPRTVSVNRPVGTLLSLLAADCLAFILSLSLASVVRDVIIPHAHRPITGTLLTALLITLATFTVAGLYPGICVNPVEELRRCCLSLVVSLMAVWSVTFVLRDLANSRLIFGVAFLLSATLIPLFRSVVRKAFSRCSWWGSQVAILGLGSSGRLLLNTLANNPQIGLKPFAVLDDNPDRHAGLDPKLSAARCRAVSKSHRNTKFPMALSACPHSSARGCCA